MSLPTKSLCLLVCLCFSSVLTQNVYGQKDTSSKKLGGFRKYVEALLEKYDSDESRTLDSEEMSKMRRKPDSAADANEDGEISVDELSKYYHSKSSPLSARRKAALSTVKDKKANVKNDTSVAITVWIVKRSGRMDVVKLKGLSKQEVESQLSKVAEDSSMQIEEYHIETTLNRSFKMVRSTQVPVIEGTSRSRNGQTMNNISKYDVGTSLTATATQNGKNVLIDFDVATSSVEDSDVPIAEVDDTVVLAKTIQTFEVEAGVECDSGKASVMQSKEKNGSWALIFCVDAEAKD